MNNAQIIALLNAGILDITTHDLDADKAYQVFLFKRRLAGLRDEIVEKQNAIGRDERKEELFAEMQKEPVSIQPIEPLLTFAEYHALAKENRAVPIPIGEKVVYGDPLSIGMEWLENVLWVALEG